MDLHTAAREGNIAEVRRIIATGAKLDERDKHSRTPLHMGGWAGHVSDHGLRSGVTLVPRLLAEVTDAADDHRWSAWSPCWRPVLTRTPQPATTCPPCTLQRSRATQKWSARSSMLVRAGAVPMPELTHALQALLSHTFTCRPQGQQQDAQGHQRTAICCQERCGMVLLLARQLNSERGSDELKHVCCAGHLATVQLLLKRKANVAAKDRKGTTALDLATDPEIRAALEQALQAAQQPQVPAMSPLAMRLTRISLEC